MVRFLLTQNSEEASGAGVSTKPPSGLSTGQFPVTALVTCSPWQPLDVRLLVGLWMMHDSQPPLALEAYTEAALMFISLPYQGHCGYHFTLLVPADHQLRPTYLMSGLPKHFFFKITFFLKKEKKSILISKTNLYPLWAHREQKWLQRWDGLWYFLCFHHHFTSTNVSVRYLWLTWEKLIPVRSRVTIRHGTYRKKLHGTVRWGGGAGGVKIRLVLDLKVREQEFNYDASICHTLSHVASLLMECQSVCKGKWRWVV